MFVLGIDPGLSTTGFGVVEGSWPHTAHAAGVIRTDRNQSDELRLREIHLGLREIVGESEAEVMAIETMFTNRNLQTAISVGRASGVAMLVAAEFDLPVFEYVPTVVKSAVTGDGSADKSRVQEMVARLLRLGQPPTPADAGDALAIALCHLRAAHLKAPG